MIDIDWEIIIFIFAVLLSVSLSAGIIMYFENILENNNELNYTTLQENYDKLKLQNNELQDKLLIQETEGELSKLRCVLNLKEEIHNRYNYTDDFKCLNFSEVFKQKARERCNVNAPIVWGALESNTSETHAWNRISLDIDTTYDEWFLERPVYDFKGEWKE